MLITHWEAWMLKLWYFGCLMRRADSLEKTLMLGKIEGRRRRRWQRTRWLDGITDSMDMSLSKLQEMVKDTGVWHATVQRVAKSWTQLSDWTSTLGGKESACNTGDLGSIPGLGRSPGGGNGYPTPVFLPGESHGQRSLAGCSPWDHEELDMT